MIRKFLIDCVIYILFITTISYLFVNFLPTQREAQLFALIVITFMSWALLLIRHIDREHDELTKGIYLYHKQVRSSIQGFEEDTYQGLEEYSNRVKSAIDKHYSGTRKEIRKCIKVVGMSRDKSPYK